MNIGELFIALGFDVDDKKLKAFKEDIKDGLQGLLKISAAAAGAVYGLNKFISGSVDSALAMRSIALETGLATEEIQRMANVMAVANPQKSPLQYAEEIKKASQILADTRFAGTDVSAFAQLGISGFLGMNALQLHDALVERAKNNKQVFNDPAFTAKLLNATGFDATEILAESQLPKEDRDRAYNRDVMTKAQQDDLIKLAREEEQLFQDLAKLRRELTVEWGHGLIEFIKKLDGSLPSALEQLKSMSEAVKSFAVGVNSLGDFAWTKLAAGMTALGLALGIIAPETVVLAAALAGISISLKEIGDYMSQPGHSWSSWFHDAGKILKPDPLGGLQVIKDYMNQKAEASDLQYQKTTNVQNFARIMSAPVNMAPNAPGNAMRPVTNTFHNLYQIHSVEDAFAIGNQISGIQTRQFNQARQQINSAGQ